MGKDLKGKELGQGLSQRKDGTYCARFTDRYGKRRSIYRKKLGELRIELNEAITNDKILGNTIYEVVTLNEWYEKWKKLFKKDVTDSTIRIYDGYYYRRISPALGDKKLTKISEVDVRELLTKIQDDGYAYSTVVKVKKLLSQMYNCAINTHYANTNPTKDIKVSNEKAEKKVHPLTQHEQKLFIEFSVKNFYHNAYICQLNTGLRPGELFGLKIEDIDFSKKTISVNKTLFYNRKVAPENRFEFHKTKTETSDRIIPMNEECEFVIRRQLEVKKDLMKKYPQNDTRFNTLIFTTKKNTPLNTSCYNSSIYKVIDKIKKNGEDIKKISGHCLRHTFATRCFEAGIKPKTIQEYLGHATIDITMNLYTHLFKEFKQKEMNKLLDLNKKIMVA